MPMRFLVAYALIAMLVAAVVVGGLYLRQNSEHRKRQRSRQRDIARHAEHLNQQKEPGGTESQPVPPQQQDER